MPNKTIDMIRQRADLYRIIRDYFHHQGVLEVEVPILGRSSALDPYLASMALESLGRTYYLQTSPELFMKRLLSRNSGSIFSICKSFREGEAGPRHNPEFTMLEWYRVGFDLESLIEDISSLIEKIIPGACFEIVTYADLFESYLGVNPHQCSSSDLQALVSNHTSYDGAVNKEESLDRSASLDLVMSQVVEPGIKDKSLFVVDYPECQAAMSKVESDAKGNKVARRFELYMRGIELANGYLELTDADEQRRRFLHDAEARVEQGLPQIPEDRQFLQALDNGVPQCSGVAMGLDRLLWVQGYMNEGIKEEIDLSRHIHFTWQDL